MLAANVEWSRLAGLLIQPEAIPVFLMVALVALFATLSATEPAARKDRAAD